MFYAFPPGYNFYQLAGRYGLPTYHDIVAIPSDPFRAPVQESSYQRVLPLLPTKPSDNRRPPRARQDARLGQARATAGRDAAGSRAPPDPAHGPLFRAVPLRCQSPRSTSPCGAGLCSRAYRIATDTYIGRIKHELHRSAGGYDHLHRSPLQHPDPLDPHSQPHDRPERHHAGHDPVHSHPAPARSGSHAAPAYASSSTA